MLPIARRLAQPPVSQRLTPRQKSAVAAEEHNPETLVRRDQEIRPMMTRAALDNNNRRGLGWKTSRLTKRR